MIIYLDRSEVPDVENIPPAVLRYLIEKAEAAVPRYCRLDDYYQGRHPILLEKPGENESKVAVNYAKYVVDIARGYYLGEPVKYDPNRTRKASDKVQGAGDVESSGAALEGETDIDISPILDCYTRQQIEKTDGKIGKGIGVFGECLELCYASTDAIPSPRSAYIDPRNGILVRDSTVEHNKLFALVWERRERSNRQKYYHVTVYTDRTVKSYEATDLETAVFRPVGEQENHFFCSVPVIAYENNDERQGDFEQIISLIDAYDRLMSNRFTDKRKFVDALLVFFGMTLSEDDKKLLTREKTIDGVPVDARVEYVQKTFDEASVQVLADAAVREMHKMTLTVDMSDEQFSGNASGQALKLKLLTMNLLVKNKIQRMEAGLKERFALYNNWLVTASRMTPVDVSDVDIRFTVSVPINESEIVQMVHDLQGIVDDQTLLSQLWFIKDPAEALENIRRQKQENQKLYQASFGVPEQSDLDDETPEDDKRPVGFARA